MNDLFHNFFARETSQNLMFQRLRENSFLLVIESGVAPLFFCWLVGHGRLAIQSAAEVIFRTINLGAGLGVVKSLHSTSPKTNMGSPAKNRPF